MIPVVKKDHIPFITREQMAEVDRLMTDVYRIQLFQMMENAGNRLARLALQFLQPKHAQQTVIILAGHGGNGGGALVAARHLSNFGINIIIVLNAATDRFHDVTGHQLSILKKMAIPFCKEMNELPLQPALIIDGLIGYGLKGAPIGKSAALIDWANDQSSPILSLDVPSGMDANSGLCFQPAIHPHFVMTLALPKTGLAHWLEKDNSNRLFLADISIPPKLYHKAFGIKPPFIFRASPILEIIF